MRPHLRLYLLGLLVILGPLRAGWEGFLDSDIFYCEGEGGRDSCGSDSAGRPMACFQGAQLGGRNFCVASCAPGTPATDSEFCTDRGEMLKRCKPSDDARPEAFPRGACGRPELACLRTDLLRDEGVCVAGTVCQTDQDCRDPVRSVCASTVVKGLYKDDPAVRSDHMFCIQAGCQARGVSCPQGESCLPNLVSPQSGPPDICVPHCDASLGCPLNHFCYRGVSTAASPSVCLAGLSSYRCRSQQECLIGDCLEVLPGAKVCTLPCQNELDCVSLETKRSWQVCGRAGGATSGPGACLSVDLFGGINCLQDSDCPGGTICSRYSPYSTSVEDVGYCLSPCGPTGQCPRPAGVPHTCFDHLEKPVCYPGKYGLYCSSPDACIGNGQCRTAMEMGADDKLAAGPICTIPCSDDQTCKNARYAGRDMYCEQGSCVLARRGGRLCTRDVECVTGACRPSERPAEEGQGIRRCTYPPGAAR